MATAAAEPTPRRIGAMTARLLALSRPVCLYVSIILTVILSVGNPLVLGMFVRISWPRFIYISVFDILALAIAFFAIRHVRRADRRDLIAALVLLISWPAVMIAAEIAINFLDKGLGRTVEPGKPILGDSVHDRDQLLGWVPRPGARGRHVSKGNFDATYVIDAKGRRAIPPNPGARQTLHFFGDSFTFGHGVDNEQTALSMIAGVLGARANVTNYGVMAYGLEQMFLRLRAAKDEIRPGDVVIFSPVALDLTRNLIAKDFVCILHEINYSKVETFPWWDGSAWRPERIADHCPHGDLPLALLQRFLLSRQSDRENAALAKNADRIFDLTRALAVERGAVMQVIFLVYPDECRARSFDFDLTLLKTNFETLMPYCPEDEALARMRFETDRHLTPEGHRWMASALLDVLERTVLKEDPP
jgi:hypothetical protein